ncbi:hypothetical protein PYCCODRAFT_1436593 [Trametes coccinea BRFM310]|uniref:F-box domain-containing protein n=1 Tax=Trametes coccinea (strain BRFM310) TaxID=1353009 RepID=A0A1Y2IN21_TRAC3|nr:hypothetical protein PYCCODRAFT_1436593 [Trametes coccinea BRFM310]
MPVIAPPLTGLPDELQIRILCGLDPPSILACRAVSSQLKETIDNSIEVYYHLELALSGMIDGPRPHGSACTRDRLTALRAYRAAYDTGKHPVQWATIESDLQNIHSRRGMHVVYHGDNPGGGPMRLAIYRPSASFCGIDEHKISVKGVPELSGNFPYVGVVYFDVHEDLLVYAWHVLRPRCHPADAHFGCRLSPLSGDHDEPHPAATQSTIVLNTPTLNPTTTGNVWPIIGFRDLIVLRYHCYSFSPAVSAVVIVNWKTGIVVWQMNLKAEQAVRLLSRTLLAVMDQEASSPAIHLYSLDPSVSSDANCSTLTDCKCTLSLPTRGDDPRFILTPSNDTTGLPSRYRYAGPSYKASSTPLFLRDPGLTPLVLRYRGGLGIRQRQYMLIVPGQTILEWAYEKRHQQRVVPWEAWGPRGARMVYVPECTSLLGPLPIEVNGSCVAICNWKGSRYVVDVYETQPYASLNSPALVRDRHATGFKSSRKPLWMPAEMKVRAPKLARKTPPINFEDPLSTKYPIRKTTRVISLKSGEQYGSQCYMLLGHDDIIILRCTMDHSSLEGNEYGHSYTMFSAANDT